MVWFWWLYSMYALLPDHTVHSYDDHNVVCL